MNKVKERLSVIWQNKITRIITIGFLSLVVVAILLAILTTQQKAISIKDNHNLNSVEKTAQAVIQEKTGKLTTSNSDVVLLNKILKTDGQWQLIQVNNSSDRYNYGYTILKNNKVKIGPSTNIDLNEMIEKGVPDSIIDYLYPDKPQWIGFDISAFDQNRNYIEGVIKAWAMQQNITLNRVTRTGDIVHNIVNERELDEAEQVSISFTINKDSKTVYHLTSTYVLQSGVYTYDITNSANVVLFRYTK